MPSDFWLIAIVVSPLLIGWFVQRYCSGILKLVALLAVGSTAILLLFSLVSTWHVEYRAAITPFDLNADGVLDELELNDDARVALSDKTPVGRFTLVALMPVVAIWNIVALAVGSAVSGWSISPDMRGGLEQLR